MNEVFLFQLGIFNIDFGTLISFLIGIVMGFIILLLVYALAVISSIRTKNFIAKTDSDDLTTQEVKDMVVRTQKSYKDKTLRKDISRITHCYSLSRDLAYGIAVRFYPKSNYPFLELSINEITLLTEYITSRVDEILNHRGIRMLRKLKISTIVNLSTKTKDIEESKAFQTTMTISQSLNKAKYVLDVINPIKWGRKLIVDRVINLIIDHICLVIIAIVGEETYKIYSKKVFNKEVELDTGAGDLIEEMSNSLKTAVMELDGNLPVQNSVPTMRFKTNVFYQDSRREVYKTYNSSYPMKQKMEVEQA